MASLHISDNDIVGSRFNGHDLHFDLQERGNQSYNFVWNESSDDDTTVLISGDRPERADVHREVFELEGKFSNHAPYYSFAPYLFRSQVEDEGLVLRVRLRTDFEASSIPGFPAATIQNAHEGPEGIDVRSLIVSALEKKLVDEAIRVVVYDFGSPLCQHRCRRGKSDMRYSLAFRNGILKKVVPPKARKSHPSHCSTKAGGEYVICVGSPLQRELA